MIKEIGHHLISFLSDPHKIFVAPIQALKAWSASAFNDNGPKAIGKQDYSY